MKMSITYQLELNLLRGSNFACPKSETLDGRWRQVVFCSQLAPALLWYHSRRVLGLTLANNGGPIAMPSLIIRSLQIHSTVDTTIAMGPFPSHFRAISISVLASNSSKHLGPCTFPYR